MIVNTIRNHGLAMASAPIRLSHELDETAGVAALADGNGVPARALEGNHVLEAGTLRNNDWRLKTNVVTVFVGNYLINNNNLAELSMVAPRAHNPYVTGVRLPPLPNHLMFFYLYLD